MLMIRGKRPFRSSYDSREDSHWGRDTSSLGTSAIIPALCSVLTYYSRIMLSAYLLFPHYAQCLPIIPALCSMLSGTYYSQNYASIIRPTLVATRQGLHVYCRNLVWELAVWGVRMPFVLPKPLVPRPDFWNGRG